MSGYRYGAWAGGPDPLEPPYDVASALDEIGAGVLDGLDPAQALAGVLRRGPAQRRGLDDLLRAVRDRRRDVRQRGRLDGTLEQVRDLLDRALEQERFALFPEPSDAARLAEAELDSLPGDVARAVRTLADYQWRSPDAAATYQEIRNLLRREVLDAQFRGLANALSGSPEEQARLKEMLSELNALLDADARGEDTTAVFAQFMDRYGDLFPEHPQTLEQLVDLLARRAAAMQRLMASLSPEQRAQLDGLLGDALRDLDLAFEMDRLGAALRARRPDLDWRSSQRMGGDEPLGVGDAVTALEELADLDELAGALRQDYPGATLADVDAKALARTVGASAVDDLRALQEIEHALSEQGYLVRGPHGLELSPKALRRIGASALARVFRGLDARGRGEHDVPDAGSAGDLTGATRRWQFGDEQPIDVVRTLLNSASRGRDRGQPAFLEVRAADFEISETERRASAAVCLLVDLSYSMALRGTWGIAKTTALALHTLVTTTYPQDAIHLVGFSDYARELQPGELAGLSWDMVQGTNLQHALLIAGRLLARHPDSEPIVLIVTDGEPTAHLARDGSVRFAWPPRPETLEKTMTEVLGLTRRGATINVFMLDDEPRLVEFVDDLARVNGGRVFSPSADRLGDYVVSDYLRARRGRRAG